MCILRIFCPNLVFGFWFCFFNFLKASFEEQEFLICMKSIFF